MTTQDDPDARLEQAMIELLHACENAGVDQVRLLAMIARAHANATLDRYDEGGATIRELYANSDISVEVRVKQVLTPSPVVEVVGVTEDGVVHTLLSQPLPTPVPPAVREAFEEDDDA